MAANISKHGEAAYISGGSVALAAANNGVGGSISSVAAGINRNA